MADEDYRLYLEYVKRFNTYNKNKKNKVADWKQFKKTLEFFQSHGAKIGSKKE